MRHRRRKPDAIGYVHRISERSCRLISLQITADVPMSDVRHHYWSDTITYVGIQLHANLPLLRIILLVLLILSSNHYYQFGLIFL